MERLSYQIGCHPRTFAIGVAAILLSGAPAEAAGSPPRPRSYQSDVDYPAAALIAGEQGTVEFSLTVGPNGRVTACTVTSSSGSATLDEATCRIMRTRAHFTPARDSDGNPIADTVSSHMRWVLPRD